MNELKEAIFNNNKQVSHDMSTKPMQYANYAVKSWRKMRTTCFCTWDVHVHVHVHTVYSNRPAVHVHHVHMSEHGHLTGPRGRGLARRRSTSAKQTYRVILCPDFLQFPFVPLNFLLLLFNDVQM